ncbi:Prefoldin subunit-domain-containing protein [Aspergillus californicus]
MGVPDNNLDGLDGLERQRLELENNIFQLQQSLYHWRTWEAEYDGLKDEINELHDDATVDDFLQVSRDFGGTLVDESEFRVIIGEKQGLKRTRQQVTDLLTRRIDYVRDNVASMERRLRSAENQLNSLDTVEQQPGEPGADFAMKEIIEELDEDGEVVSSKTTTPGDQASDLLDILKKAGVKDIPDVPESSNPAASGPSSPKLTPKNGFAQENKQEVQRAGVPTVSVNTTSAHGNGDFTAAHNESAAASSTAAEKETPIVDINESPEDAKLRREMIQYGLDEVGAVVAELEFDDEASEVSVDENDLYTYDDDDDEDEDEYGRSVGSVLDDDYHQQMRELEAKWNARGMMNVGKDVETLPEAMQEDLEQAGKVKIERTPESTSQPASTVKTKKKVAFADDVDIAPAPSPPVSETKKAIFREIDVPVLSDSIVERKAPAEKDTTASDTPAPKKTSRFKAARDSAATTDQSIASHPIKPQRKTTSSPSPALPLFPARPPELKPFSQPILDIAEKPPSPVKTSGKILADILVERDTSKGNATAPEPDDLDEELHRKEIATEFYKMKNRMANQNANNLDDEPEMVPVQTEETQPRISKFRASRMG